ncbi:metal-sulfur cluster assembly factor [Sulfobacillus thermosulfidooxidans]|nr:hypothetical protein [Sulfobacillus thermosulfidooxidans]
MTTPGCPTSQFIQEGARQCLLALPPEVNAVTVDIVWSPPWDPSMMT